MKSISTLCLLALLTMMLTACGSESDSGSTPAAEPASASDAQAETAAAASEPEPAAGTSQVTFDYSGDFEGSSSTGAVIAGRMTDELTAITANLDGYSSQSDTLVIQLRNEDFEVGAPSEVFVEDRNTVTLTMDGYALQLQPGSTLTVLEKSATVFRAEADELVLTGYEVMDFQRENPAKTVTISNLSFEYFD